MVDGFVKSDIIDQLGFVFVFFGGGDLVDFDVDYDGVVFDLVVFDYFWLFDGGNYDVGGVYYIW